MRHAQVRDFDRFSRRARLRCAASSLVADAPVVPELPSCIDPALVPPYAMAALGALLDAGKQAFLVGGFVRDALRGAPCHDVDIATDALWYQVRDIFAERGYRVLETGVRHGTVTVVSDGRPVEVTTFRTEGAYTDHRRPDTVRYVRDIEDDLARRDFTVNAMAWSPASGFVDPFGGRADLAQRVVRAVGEPRRRFGEDALRVMRGVRFASKLGFSVDEATDEAIHACAGDLALVARERIAAEYDGIVQGAGAVAALRAYPDVAACAVPAIAAMVGFEQRSAWHCHDVWEHCLHALEAVDPAAPPLVRHVVLLHDVGKPACFAIGPDGRGHFYGHEAQGARMLRRSLENLRWRSRDVDRAVTLVRLHDRRIEPTVRGARRMLARLGSSFPGAEGEAVGLFRDLLQVKRADALAHAPGCVGDRLAEIAAVEASLSEVVAAGGAFCLHDLAVGGRDLMALGIPQGPGVGQVLRGLLRRVVDGRLPNERGALLEAARALSDRAGAAEGAPAG